MKQERIMSFQMSRQLNSVELDCVSGADSTTRYTNRPTGGVGEIDMGYDYGMDFS